MVEIIWIVGPTDSGKTGSIKMAMNNLKIFSKNTGKDIRVAVELQTNQGPKMIGFASGGDDSSIINNHFIFFYNLTYDKVTCPHNGNTQSSVKALENLDYLVLASKSSGSDSYIWLDTHIRAHNYPYTQVATTRLPRSQRTAPNILANNVSVCCEILRLLP